MTPSLTARLPGAPEHEPPVRIRPLRGRDEQWLTCLPPETPREQVVTQVLARRVGLDEATLHGLPVGERDYLVLKLIEVSFGKRVELVVSCPRATCHAPMDVDFAIGDLPLTRTSRDQDHPIPATGSEPTAVRFRLPVGADLEDPEITAAADPAGALLARCLVEGDAAAVLSDPTSRAAVDDEIERVMPGLPRELSLSCPDCGHEFETALDPVAWLVDRVLRGEALLQREIHLLAYHYHWSLRSILAMSGPARREYVALLEHHLDLATP